MDLTKRLLLITFFPFVIQALWCQEYNIRIEGQLIGYDGVSELHYSFSGANYGHATHSVKPDSSGRFTLNKRIRNTKFFRYHLINKNDRHIHHKCALIVQPGSNYLIISRGQDRSEWKTIEDYKEPYSPDIYTWEVMDSEAGHYLRKDYGQIYYNKIDNGLAGSAFHDDWDLYQPDELIDSLKYRINSQVSVFNDLLERGDINSKFYEIARLNIQYYNAYQLVTTIQDIWTHSEKYGIADTLIVNKLINVQSEVFELFPLEEVRLEYVFLPWRYIETFLYYTEATKKGSFSPPDNFSLSNVDIDDIRTVLPEEIFKFYAMRVTTSRLAGLDLGALNPARELIDEFPDLKLTSYGEWLENVLIPKAEELEIAKERGLSDQIIFLDEEKPINTFQQLLENFENKPLLIDLWGTWCSPCRYQFQYNDTINAFLNEHGINKVYIAREYVPDRDNWKTIISTFELTGYHVMANDKLWEDMKQSGIEIEGFPTYMIVNPDGEIVEPSAHFPSETNELFRQLTEKLGLEN